MEIATKDLHIVPLNELSTENQLLVEACVSAREKAYAPYSKFNVGAALRCDDGTIFTGCNVENASYGLGICAERTAIVKAVSEGKRSFTSVAVSGVNNNHFVPPCGGCRQFLSEFVTPESDMTVLLYQPEGPDVFVTSVNELLPFQFYFQ